MTVEQAIQILDSLVASVRGTREERASMELALKVLIDKAKDTKQD